MKALLVTEKCSPKGEQRDGGARVVDTLLKALGDQVTVLQFGEGEHLEGQLHFDYPFDHENRFIRRIKNASFIGEKIAKAQGDYSHLIFIHASMQFSLVSHPPKPDQKIWTFPMFLSPSYKASGEIVPSEYVELEKTALSFSHKIITPSHFEKTQLMTNFGIPEKKLSMIPRGIERDFLPHRERNIENAIHFCSVGSIKPQKNTLELLKLFKLLLRTYPSAHLTIIGPVQNISYQTQVEKTLEDLELKESVSFLGHIPPKNLGKALDSCHIHLSTTRCETFGRSIFETLSLGIPNVAFRKNNASFEFLHPFPYIRYAQNIEEAVREVQFLLGDYETLSSLSKEVGLFYDDTFLRELLLAHIHQKETLVISDFDGTLWHKHSKEKTRQSLSAFSTYPKKVICTARHPRDILKRLIPFGVEVDWVIGLSGAIITDGTGRSLWTVPLTIQNHLESHLSLRKVYDEKGNLLQLFGPEEEVPHFKGLRREVYKGEAFLQQWSASKLFAIHTLLKTIQWEGKVRIYGDGPYDQEMINYFDGKMITSDPESMIETKEKLYEEVLL